MKVKWFSWRMGGNEDDSSHTNGSGNHQVGRWAEHRFSHRVGRRADDQVGRVHGGDGSRGAEEGREVWIKGVIHSRAVPAIHPSNITCRHFLSHTYRIYEKHHEQSYYHAILSTSLKSPVPAHDHAHAPCLLDGLAPPHSRTSP